MNFDGLRPSTNKPQEIPANTIKEPALLTWEGQSFERNLNAKNISVLLGILVLLAGYSVWQKDWFTIAILAVVAGITTWYLATSKPISTTYTITSMGIYAGERFYSFSELHSFWLVYNQVVQELFLAFDRKYLPALSINIKTVDPVTLKSILLKKIPEQTRRRESLIDKSIRFLGL